MSKIFTDKQIIVSLTSFPEAIPYAVQAIRSIIHGSLLPDKIILYLDSWKYPDGILPLELETLKAECPFFDVKFDPANIRSYKKLIPALKDFPNDVIVTIDDDIAYHPDMLRRLIDLHKQLPHDIISHRVRKIQMNSPYRKWRKFKWYDFILKRIIHDRRSLQTGVGGVLYPPHSLDENMLDSDIFMKLAPTNDDIWFWAAAVSKGTYIVPVPGWHQKLVEIGKPAQYSLKTINIDSTNDQNRIALQNILEHYPTLKEKLNA